MSAPKFDVKYYNPTRQTWIYGVKAKPEDLKDKFNFVRSKMVWAYWHYPEPNSHVSFGWLDASEVEEVAQKPSRNLPEWW